MREQANQQYINRPQQLMQANQLANMRRNGTMNNLQKTVLQNNSAAATLYVIPLFNLLFFRLSDENVI
jgi:hypothetical protein